MKKITLSSLLLSFFLIATSMFAQEKRQIQKSTSDLGITQNQSSINTTPLQLSEENQRSIAETGYARCVSVEMHERRLQREPRTQTDEEFEAWLAPLMEARRSEIEAQKANGTHRMAVVYIPIIFHIISSGGASNISDAQVQAQIDQLNIDFANLAGSTDPVAADAQVVFLPATVDPSGNTLAVPGVDRVTAFGSGPFPTTDFDLGDGGLEIKPATVWDRSQYANIWTADISGGILGYAQFPSNSTLPGLNANGGSALNDGVVIGYGTAGSVANPGSAAPYNLGRTLTHEFGHWIGLRHIWGDGGCAVDDFVTDTPDAGGANYGTAQNTSCSSADMVENYMDYTDDSIMNIFTAGQVLRIDTVIANADGISDLPNSTTAAADPTVTFSNATLTTSEGTGCSFTDVTIDLRIGAFAPTQNAVASITAPAGTASSGSDFTLLNSTATFAQGLTEDQSITLRIFNDGFVEGDETIDLTFTLNANGGNAVIGNNNMTITITDDDTVPVNTQSITVLDSDQEAADTTDWFIIDNDGDGNNFGGATGLTYTGIDGGFFISESNGSALGNGGNFSPDNLLFTDLFTLPAGATNINLSYGVGGFQDSEPFEVYWSTDDTSAATILAGNAVDGGTSGNSAGEIRNVDLTAYAGETGILTFRHLSQGNGPARTDGILLIDNVLIEATIAKFIQTAVNDGSSNDLVDLPGSGSIYTSDAVSTDLMLDITNNNSFDYGCVDISVSRAGNSTQSYNGSTGNDLVMDKTFDITPGSTTNSGDITIDFYVTAAEMTGFTSTTSLTSNDVFAFREGSNDIVALTATAFGSDFKLSGDFTGLNGKYYLGAEGAFSKVELAVNMLLSGPTYSGGLMSDELRVAGYIPTTSPYADALTCNATVFNTTGANAIVDWVWLELRDATDNTVIEASTSALLQRDGDVVGVDGSSNVVIPTSAKNYYIVINHRNHLGAMTNATVALSSTPTTVDFTSGMTTFGTDAQKDMGSGTMALWAGDANGNNNLNYIGAQSEITAISTHVFNDPANTVFGGPPTATYSSLGYSNADVNMDGITQYLGAGTDITYISDNIFNNPSNTVFGGPPTATYVFTAQLP